METKKSFFSDKFINEENLAKIENQRTINKFSFYFFCFLVFSLLCPLFPTFVGYNFEHKFSVVMFFVTMLFFTIFIIIYIKFLLLDSKYKVFKNRGFAVLFASIPLFLCIVFMIIPIFTTEFIPRTDGGFEVNFSPAFYLLILPPLIFGYVFFIYPAFFKCFAKYAAKSKNNKNNLY